MHSWSATPSFPARELIMRTATVSAICPAYTRATRIITIHSILHNNSIIIIINNINKVCYGPRRNQACCMPPRIISTMVMAVTTIYHRSLRAKRRKRHETERTASQPTNEEDVIETRLLFIETRKRLMETMSPSPLDLQVSSAWEGGKISSCFFHLSLSIVASRTSHP